jgi:hypothetical protein
MNILFKKTRKIILFVILGIPGALLFVFSSIIFLIKIFDPKVPTGNFTLVVLILTGTILTLVGLEKLHQWKYILVFASIPFSFFLAGLVAIVVTMIGLPVLLLPTTALLIFALPYFVNKIVKRHYDKPDVAESNHAV